ncbi:Uncharacterized membrane protein [Proteiniborus ethanoligenes]|uniref:Uncharacterized membrane protein n=1 Tax=Proteiniborus ethanoligenes TaxID=415015 RepID=A0A1H3Q1J1_9FIRM|nr:YibE/F family protein [Proteiniborus ethanoligenes]TAH64118.1 MAG: YibE/F family protein [Gottschalkiaceae bacterium]SDZ06599.1 Uncharacterized membrane protein [Proteiniborus ethanoligenes]
MKRFIIIILLIFLVNSSFSFSEDEYNDLEENFFYARGEVIEVISDVEGIDYNDINSLNIDTQILKIRITSGKYKGQEFIIENHVSGNPVFDIIVKNGDKVLLDIEEDSEGIPSIYITDFIRDTYLGVLLLIFAGLLIVIGKIKGIKSIISLAITGTVILKFMLPMILKGFNPIWVAILSATIITSISFVIIAGINFKSFSAIIGTVGGVVFAGFIAYTIGSLVKLTGLHSEEANMLMFIPQQISFNFQGLLFSGIIIGTLGAVMDVAMSISSAMYEMKALNPEISSNKLIVSGLNIGKDVMGTMSNTLILAYTGSSVPLMLLFMAYETSIIKIINLDMIATEIVRALSGSIGLIIAIPITAMATGLILKYEHIFPKSQKPN